VIESVQEVPPKSVQEVAPKSVQEVAPKIVKPRKVQLKDKTPEEQAARAEAKRVQDVLYARAKRAAMTPEQKEMDKAKHKVRNARGKAMKDAAEADLLRLQMGYVPRTPLPPRAPMSDVEVPVSGNEMTDSGDEKLPPSGAGHYSARDAVVSGAGYVVRKHSSAVQALLFDRARYTPDSAIRWTITHGYRPLKGVHTTPHENRVRLQGPDEFGRFVTKTFGDGIKAVIGYR
jgi:hypothetical protein